MITASHNPWVDNGAKVVIDGKIVGREDQDEINSIMRTLREQGERVRRSGGQALQRGVEQHSYTNTISTISTINAIVIKS